MLTEYHPRPESTDSEYNDLRAQLTKVSDLLEAEHLITAVLRTENANLREHLDADHALLQVLGGWPNALCDAQARHQRAADDGPEAVFYDWSTDEDSAEYQFPEQPKTADSV